MDITTLIIGLCLVGTGAVFFGYPIGLKHGARMTADRICNSLESKDEPFLVRDARRRLDRRNTVNVEVIQ